MHLIATFAVILPDLEGEDVCGVEQDGDAEDDSGVLNLVELSHSQRSSNLAPVVEAEITGNAVSQILISQNDRKIKFELWLTG